MVSTKERLAQVLHAAGLLDLEEKARRGDYDDFESSSATPICDLVNDLNRRGQFKLSERAMNGEFDATKEEADAWYEREGKNLLS